MNGKLESRLDDWLRAFGFTENPFSQIEAEQDPRLHEYFVEPTCFDTVLGTAVSPQTAVLFAPRGGGKTANRVMVDHFCKIGERTQGGVLSISYTKFDDLIHLISWGPNGAPSQVNVHAHVVQVLKRGTVDILEALEARRLSLNGRGESACRTLVRTLGVYGDIEALPRTLTLFSQIGLEPNRYERLLWQAREQSQRDGIHPLRDLENLVGTLVALDVSAVYVLVDRIDEFHPASFDPMAGALFLSPLLSHLSLLEIEHMAFKFFLPSHMKSILLKCGILRPDRLKVEEIVWSDEDLLKTLNSRLYAFSDRQIPTLEPLFVSPQLAEKAEQKLVACAEGSPRDLVLACNQLFATHTQHFVTDEELRIGQESLERAIEIFTRERARWRPTPSRPIGFKTY